MLPLLHSQHTISELFSQLRMDTLINPHRMKHQAHRQQGVHLFILFIHLLGKEVFNFFCLLLFSMYEQFFPVSVWKYYLIIQIGFVLDHLLSSLYIEQNVRERSDGILVPSHHHISKPNVVESTDLTGSYSRRHRLFQRKNNSKCHSICILYKDSNKTISCSMRTENWLAVTTLSSCFAVWSTIKLSYQNTYPN